jgi:hypothetical protein
MRSFLICTLFLTTVATASGAPWSRLKGGSQVTVTIKHEAQVRTPLQQVAFAEPTGQCSDLLTDSLVADFASSGAVVIDRINFKRIMAEHKLNLGGAINEKTAAKIGKLIGTGSLIFVKVHDCSTYHTREFRAAVDGIGVKRNQVPTTRGALKASIQIVNLTTGVTSAARVINAKASISADEVGQSRLGRVKDAAMSVINGATRYDEYPAPEEVHTVLFLDAVEQVHRLLFPWTETKQFHFFDDNACALNVAYRLMQNGDLDGAAREAQVSLDTCKSTPSVPPVTLARAHYNRGMASFLAGDYDAALVNLSQAARLDKSSVFTDALAECNRVRSATTGKPEKKPAQVTADSTPKSGGTPKGDGGPVTNLTPEERLRRLEELHKKKLISDVEYEKKRREILAEL